MTSPDLTMTALRALTPAQRAQWRRDLEREEAVPKDKTWQLDTLPGPHIKRYLDYKAWQGLEPNTIENREVPYRRLAYYYADKTIGELSGREGARLIEDFLMHQYGDSSDATKAQRTSVLRNLFDWCYREGLVEQNPFDFIERRRSVKQHRRQAHEQELIVRIIDAQPRLNWRIAVLLMARLGFRLNDLRTCKLGHFDFAERVVHMFGKGSKPADLPMFPELADEVERYVMERSFLHPDYRLEYLLFPLSPRRTPGNVTYVAEDRDVRRLEPYSRSGVGTWWRGCCDRAGVARFPMHELRHTAGTHFHLGPAKGDYELTRQFMRHENVATTARYVHSPPRRLAEAMTEAPRWQE